MTFSDGFGHSLWRLHRECQKRLDIDCNTGKEKGRKKQEGQTPHPPKQKSSCKVLRWTPIRRLEGSVKEANSSIAQVVIAHVWTSAGWAVHSCL